MMNREFLIDFIETYKQHTALWKVKSPEYSSRHLKKAGYMALIDVCKKYKINDATEDMVRKKIQSLRSTFRKEFNKQEKLISSGIDKPHTPNLWYYNLLLFVKDQEQTPLNSHCTNSPSSAFEDSITIEESDEEQQEVEKQFSFTEIKQENLDDDSNPQEKCPSEIVSTSYITNEKIQEDRKRKREYQSGDELSRKHADSVSSIGRNDIMDDSTAFGLYVGTKLRIISSPSQKVYAETLITQILQKAVLNKLSESTRIADTT